MKVTCPYCNVESTFRFQLDDTGTCPSCGRVVHNDLTRSSKESAQAPNQDATRSFEVPVNFGDRFAGVKFVADGGFGRVYRARDRKLGIDVALKHLHPQYLEHKSKAMSFALEAKALANLRHPNIVKIFNVEEDDEGSPFIVMEWIEGKSLKEKIADSKFSVGEACKVMLQIADAVSHAHERGLIHRDLKPSNILVDESGNPIVADFGLAFDSNLPSSQLFEIAGSLPYMSPEQLSGNLNLIDGRSDIWAMGAIFYEMLSQKKPFNTRGTIDDFRMLVTEKPLPPLRQRVPDVPAELDEVIQKAMEKSIDSRFQTSKDFASAIASVQSPKHPTKLLGLESPAKWKIASIVLVVVLLIGAALASFWTKSPEATTGEFSTVKELVFDEESSWYVDDGKLHLTASKKTFLEFGQSDSDDFQLDVTISQPSWEGNVGVFFGLDDNRFQLLQLKRRHRESFSANLSDCSYLYSPAVYNSESKLSEKDFIEKVSKREIKLTVLVEKNVVKKILVDDVELVDLREFTRVKMLPCKGRFGIFANRSFGAFSSIKVE